MMEQKSLSRHRCSVAAQRDEAPDRLDRAEGRSAGQKAVDTRHRAPSGEGSDEHVAATLKGATAAATPSAISTRAAYRHTWHDVRSGERLAALLRDARDGPATRAAPRWPD